MTFLQLKYFCTACELASITKAAEKRCVTQPAVSTAIRELEQEFQIRLLNRRSKGMALTDEGMTFYREASEGGAFGSGLSRMDQRRVAARGGPYPDPLYQKIL